MRIIITLLLASSFSLQAANHYIRAAATGSNDGSSWTNAFTAIPTSPASLIRGDTYFIAGGTYPGNVTLASAVSGSTTVTLKKANSADNGADAGWDAAYASGQAVITGTLQIANSYMTLDGVTGAGESGYGIKVYPASVSSGNAIVNQTSMATNVQVMHLEIQGPGMGAAAGVSGYKNYNTTGTVKGIRFANNYLHDLSQNGTIFINIVGTSYSDYGLLYENNVLHNSGDNVAGGHGQGIQCGSGAGPATHSYWIIRNSDFHNIAGAITGDIACLGYTTNDHFRIYNNLFRNDNLSYQSATLGGPGWIDYSNSFPATSPGVIYFSSTAQSAADMLIANNTFYQMSRATVYNVGTATNNIVVNNLWVNSNFNIVTQGAVGSYNDYYGCFPIITSSIYGVPYGEVRQKTESGTPLDSNLRLLAGTNAIGGGQNLSSEFTTDAAGVSRPANGAWDIGAYQYAAGPPPPSATPNVTGSITGSMYR